MAVRHEDRAEGEACWAVVVLFYSLCAIPETQTVIIIIIIIIINLFFEYFEYPPIY